MASHIPPDTVNQRQLDAEQVVSTASLLPRAQRGAIPGLPNATALLSVLIMVVFFFRGLTRALSGRANQVFLTEVFLVRQG